jgi:ABC-2 type transport system ATP-binding protein
MGEPQTAGVRDPSQGSSIVARGLTKRFGDFTAVDAIDFEVAKGEIFGFLGPNGSGKSTTIRMLCGLLPPTTGEARVQGVDLTRDPEAVKPLIGYMSQRFSLYDDLTVDENLTFFGGVYGVHGPRFAERRRFILEMADLGGREDELAGNLSVGWKQRLALGTAIIHEPPLIFLDEPTGGVDPVARRNFWDMLYEMAAKGTTLFVTTHYMDEAEYCNTLAFIHEGRLIAKGSPREIKAEFAREGTPRPTLDDVFVTLVADSD